MQRNYIYLCDLEARLDLSRVSR